MTAPLYICPRSPVVGGDCKTPSPHHKCTPHAWMGKPVCGRPNRECPACIPYTPPAKPPQPTDLLPCPHCGWHLIELTHALGEYWCRCHKCSSSTLACASVHDAVAAWNLRAHSPAVRGLVEAANDACKRLHGPEYHNLVVAISRATAEAPVDREGGAA